MSSVNGLLVPNNFKIYGDLAPAFEELGQINLVGKSTTTIAEAYSVTIPVCTEGEGFVGWLYLNGQERNGALNGPNYYSQIWAVRINVAAASTAGAATKIAESTAGTIPLAAVAPVGSVTINLAGGQNWVHQYSLIGQKLT